MRRFRLNTNSSGWQFRSGKARDVSEYLNLNFRQTLQAEGLIFVPTWIVQTGPGHKQYDYILYNHKLNISAYHSDERLRAYYTELPELSYGKIWRNFK